MALPLSFITTVFYLSTLKFTLEYQQNFLNYFTYMTNEQEKTLNWNYWT